MNYITLINSFWDSVTINPLSTGQVSLYMALLHIYNRSSWTEWFTAPNQVLSVLTGLSRSGILKARNELKQKGLIDFKERGTRATVYKVVTMSDSTQDSVQDSVQDGVRKGNQVSVQNSGTLYKQKQRQRQKNIADAIQEKFSDDENLNEAVSAFVDYRKGIGAAMSAHAVELLLKSLEKLAPGDNQTKTEILNQSIVNGWKGVFRLDQHGKNHSQTSSSKNQFHNFHQRDTDYDAMILEGLRKEQEKGSAEG